MEMVDLDNITWLGPRAILWCSNKIEESEESEESLQQENKEVGRVCSGCLKFEEREGRKHRYCSACKCIFYCSKICQTADWRKHRLVCKRMARTSLCSEPVRYIDKHEFAIANYIARLGTLRCQTTPSVVLIPKGKNIAIWATFREIARNPVIGQYFSKLQRSFISSARFKERSKKLCDEGHKKFMILFINPHSERSFRIVTSIGDLISERDFSRCFPGGVINFELCGVPEKYRSSINNKRKSDRKRSQIKGGV